MIVRFIYTVWYDENDCNDGTLIITRIVENNRKSIQQFDERASYTVKNLFSRVIAQLSHCPWHDIIKNNSRSQHICIVILSDQEESNILSDEKCSFKILRNSGPTKTLKHLKIIKTCF